MTANEWAWLLVGAIGLLLLVGALFLGAYLIVRDWRESQAQRGRQEYQPPDPLLHTPAPHLPSPDRPLIQWGDQSPYQEMPPPPSESGRIQWGEALPDWEWTQVSPINSTPDPDDESVKCPICRQRINEATDLVVGCPECGNLYHLNCLAEMEYVCSSCGKELS